MEINSYQNNSVKKLDLSLLEPQKQGPSTVSSNTENPQDIDLPSADSALLRVYAGVANDAVSKNEVFEYLRNAGVKNETVFDSVVESISNQDGVVTRQAFAFLQALLPKTNVYRVKDYFIKAKDENGINFKALKVLDTLLPPASPMGQKTYFDTLLSDMKDKNGVFNDSVMRLVAKNAGAFQKAYAINQTVPIRFFRSLKDKDGMFEPQSLAFAVKELNAGKLFYNLTSLINSSKDENGVFSFEKHQMNSMLKEEFDGYNLQLVHQFLEKMSDKDKKEIEKFLNFAKSIKTDSWFREILKFIDAVKSSDENNIGIDYNQKSYEFLKKFNAMINFKRDNILSALKAINKPYSEYTEKEFESLLNLIMFLQDDAVVSGVIEIAKINAGKDKGKVDFGDVAKAQTIIAKSHSSTDPHAVKELAGCLSKEEDSRALDFIYDLYNYEFKEADDKKSVYSSVFSSTSVFDDNVIRTIIKFLSEPDENCEAQHKIDSVKIDELKALVPKNATRDDRDFIQKKLFFKALDLPLPKEKERSINTNIDDICMNVLKDASFEKIKAFRDFVKNTFDSTSGIFFLDKNDNMKSRVNIQTGNPLNPKTIIYDVDLCKPISETFETWKDGIQTKVTADFLNGSEINQSFEYVKLNDESYKVLRSQSYKKYDNKGNLLFTEVVEQSPIDNVFNITKVYPDGTTENISKSVKTLQGTEVIEKQMTSFDGTKSYYRYEDDPEGNRILDYKIVDENGKTLLDESVTFEVLGENHFLSAKNGKSFDIKFSDQKLVVTNEQTGQKAEFNLPGFTHGTPQKIVPILKKIPGDELFSMKELDLKAVMQDNNVQNAQYSGEKITTSDDFNELAVILHEWGHGKDDLMFKEINEKINNDPKLNEIYNKERELFRKNMSDAQLSLISYFTADNHYLGDKAVKEGIAETNTVLNVSPKNSTQSVRAHYWQQYFPKTIAYLADFLN